MTQDETRHDEMTRDEMKQDEKRHDEMRLEKTEKHEMRDETKRDDMSQDQTRPDEMRFHSVSSSALVRAGELKSAAVIDFASDGGQRSIQVLICLISGDINSSNQVRSSLSLLSASRETDG